MVKMYLVSLNNMEDSGYYLLNQKEWKALQKSSKNTYDFLCDKIDKYPFFTGVKELFDYVKENGIEIEEELQDVSY